jgi:hypothetical protein
MSSCASFPFSAFCFSAARRPLGLGIFLFRAAAAPLKNKSKAALGRAGYKQVTP